MNGEGKVKTTYVLSQAGTVKLPTNIEYEAAIAESPPRSPPKPKINPSQQAKELSEMMQKELEDDIVYKRTIMQQKLSANLAAA